ncbi:MAG: hypothetical protein JWN98_2326, partial [Abditibacteriota bacterium]|nr:hypothetical protein [Abditibacteriota bacterium]
MIFTPILAKVLSPPLAAAFYSLLPWPILTLCIRHWDSGQNFRADETGIALTQAIACTTILAGVALMTTSWALACSRLFKKTATATGWTIGSL